MVNESAPKTVFHVITRGNNRAKVFHDSDDYHCYLEILSHYKREFDFALHHFTLIPNHVHLQLSCLPKDLPQFMKCINQTYTYAYKKRYGFVGHLWQNRFRRYIIDSDSYLLTCGIYIELNPVRAGLCNEPESYPWSSCAAYLTEETRQLIEPNAAFNSLGDTIEQRKAVFATLVQMWREKPMSKKDARKFFRAGASSFHPKTQ